MIRLTLLPADELERQLKDAKLIGFIRDKVRPIPGRKFRADFCWPADAVKLVVEVDGGTFAREGSKRCPLCGEVPKGRHATGTGRETDCEKLNLAVLAGWRYLVFTTQQVRDGRALIWIQKALMKEAGVKHRD